MPELVEPTPLVRESFVRAMDGFIAEGRGAADDDSALGRNIRTYGPTWRTEQGFVAFIEALHSEGDVALPAPEGWVHSTTYWYLDRDEYLGSIRLRHELTPYLLEEGGHIGYDIAPSARLRGHGTAMLREALPIAAKLGIDPVLITCDNDNVGSRKIIEANGGVYEDERNSKLRFWVSTQVSGAPGT
ncbi:GNAT family N-acetyltransferase [Jatrophihabitans sp. DSM 45814]